MTPAFTSDWFSKAIPHWEAHVVPRLAGVEDARWLEVGSYEGRSALWAREHVLTGKGSVVACLDVWHPEYETSFDANTAGVMGIIKWRGSALSLIHI